MAREMAGVRRGAAAHTCPSPPEHAAVISLLAVARTGRSSSGKRIFGRIAATSNDGPHVLEPRQVRRRVLWRSSARPAAPRAAAVVRRCPAGTLRARQSVCVQLPCWISSSAVARRAGPQIALSWVLRARTGRTRRPRSGKKIIARQKRTNFPNSPACGAGAELRRGRHLLLGREEACP